MGDDAADLIPGLRERKKLRTRSTLVDAAAELCLAQGYDNTTVEQIAAAAEVSPRTFSRYFPTKDAVITAIIEDVARFVAAELADQPADITEYEALLRAHLAALQPDPDCGRTAIFHRMAALIQIVNSSANLVLSNIPFSQDPDRFPTLVETAKRMRLPTGHDAVLMVIESWTAVMNTACRGLGTPGQPPIEPGIVCDRITAAYELFTRSWQPWTASVEANREPPGGALGP
ncbi:MAG: TetR/AcrR family transcriptional regulator [Mycobacterium sp.]